MTSMKSFALILLVLGHVLTQFGLTVPDLTWRPWIQANIPHGIALCFWALLGIRMAADIGICLWLLGPERRGLALKAVASWFHPLLRVSRR